MSMATLTIPMLCLVFVTHVDPKSCPSPELCSWDVDQSMVSCLFELDFGRGSGGCASGNKQNLYIAAVLTVSLSASKIYCFANASIVWDVKYTMIDGKVESFSPTRSNGTVTGIVFMASEQLASGNIHKQKFSLVGGESAS